MSENLVLSEKKVINERTSVKTSRIEKDKNSIIDTKLYGQIVHPEGNLYFGLCEGKDGNFYVKKLGIN
jgi:hypothetical protein